MSQNFNIGVSYSLAAADPSNTIGINDSSTYINSYSSINSSVVKGSYGKGQSVYIFLEYRSKKNISFELKFGYHKGASYYTSAYLYDDNHSGGNGNTKENHEYHSFTNISQFQINPSLKFLLVDDKADGKIKPYLKVGVVCGVGNKMTENISTSTRNYSYYTFGTSTTTTFSSEITNKFYKGISFGYQGGVGLEYEIASKFAFLTELSFIGMNWAPKYSKYDKYIYTMDGQIIPTSRPEVTQYGNSIPSINTIFSKTSSTSALKIYKPYSSINFQIGFRFTFGKKAKDIPASK